MPTPTSLQALFAQQAIPEFNPARIVELAYLLLLGPLIALLVLIFTGVFRRHSIEGPLPLRIEESPGPLAMNTLVGGFVYMFFIPMLFGMFIRASSHTRPTTAPFAPTMMQTTLLGALMTSGGFLTLLSGGLLVRPNPLRHLGLSIRKLPRGLPLAALAMLAVMPIVQWTMFGSGLLWQALHLKHANKHDMLQILDKTADPRVKFLVVIGATLLAPLFEELFFRGHLQTLVRHITRRRWIGVFVASSLFASLHPWWSAPAIFVLSIGLGYVYERTGNLWASIFMHILFNSTSVVVELLTTHIGSPQ
jgi:membrane protease YdiL (CAAX protease family)